MRSVSLLSHLWSHQESSLSFVQSWVPYETAGRYTGVLKVCHPWWVNVSHSKSLFPAVCPFGASTPRHPHQFPIHTDLSLSITVLYICLCACTAFGVNCLMFRVKNYCRQCFVRDELLVNDYLSGSLACKTRWQDDPTVLTEYNAAEICAARLSEDSQMEMKFSYSVTTGRISQNITSSSIKTVATNIEFLTASFIQNVNSITVLSGKRDKGIELLTFKDGHSMCRTFAWISEQKTVNS